MSRRARAIGDEFVEAEAYMTALNLGLNEALSVEGRIKRLIDSEGITDPTEIAMALCEEDVAAGEYEGCSSELDLAASEYIAVAQRLKGGAL